MLGGPRRLGLEGGLGAHAVVAELLQPSPPRPMVAGHVQLCVEAGKDPLVGVEPGVVGSVDPRGVDPLVGVAPHGGLVAGSTGGSGDVVEAIVERRAVADHTVVELVGACVEARPPRRARRALAVVPSEPNAARSQPIEVRGPHHRVAGGRQGVSAELVQGHEQDVGTGHPPSLACGGRSSAQWPRGGTVRDVMAVVS